MLSRFFRNVAFYISAFVFGLAMPVFAFTLAYPGGPSDMYYRVMYEQEMQKYNKPKNFTLQAGFSLDNMIQYIIQGVFIERASAKDRIIITISENVGGVAALLLLLEEQIKNSKAFIIMTVDKFGLSCGTYILAHGNVLVLPNDALLLFHFGNHTDSTGKSAKTTADGTSIENRAAYNLAFKQLMPYKSWVTSSEFEKITKGGDVFLTGAQICNKTSGRKVDVLFYTKDGCVIRGLKK